MVNESGESRLRERVEEMNLERSQRLDILSKGEFCNIPLFLKYFTFHFSNHSELENFTIEPFQNNRGREDKMAEE